MACFRPISAFQSVVDGAIYFREVKDSRSLQLPCGSCVGCRYVRMRSWSIRCVHEAQCHSVNSFVTLTYDDVHLPSDLGIDYRHFQLFMKRLRKTGRKARFFCAGEYGSITKRPHLHALLFGVGFSNLKECGKSLYRSAELESLWPYGFSSIGEVNSASAAYCAKYAVKGLGAKVKDEQYRRVDGDTGEVWYVPPEKGRMSLKPAIGYKWFQKYWRDVYVARDGVVLPGGQVVPPPKYYDRLLDQSCGVLLEEKQFDRYVNSKRFAEDCSPERLLVREQCALARSKRIQERLK